MANRFIDRTNKSGDLDGSWTFTNNSTSVTCPSGGNASILEAGDYVKPSTTNEWYKVASIVSDNEITLSYAFKQSTQSGVTCEYADKSVNDGTTTAKAFVHPNQATTDEVRSAGDKIYMRRGQTHLIESVKIEFDEDGQPNNPITLRGDDGTGWSGETGLSKPVIDLGDKMSNEIHFNGGDKHWTLDDFEVKNNNYVAVDIRANSEGIHCKNLKIHDNGWGFYVNGSYGILVEDCDIDDSSNYNLYGYYCDYTVRRTTVDGGPVGLRVTKATTVFLDDVQFGATTAHTTADIEFSASGVITGRNVTLNSTTKVKDITDCEDARLLIEDYGGTKLDNRAWYFHGTIKRNTTVTRSGGADSSAEVEPNSNCGTRWKLKMFEMVIWASATQKTYQVYLRGSGWSTFPTASELWIEVEYFSSESDADRTITKSDEVLTENNAWTLFEVPNITPTAAGPLYLRGYLAKYESGAKIYVDIKPVVS